MTTTPERSRAAKSDIARAMKSRQHAFVLHYVGESFASVRHRVTAIAARNLGSGVTECFELENELRRSGVNPLTASSDELDRAERRVLDAFYAFVRSHPNYFWLHWNMRNSTFGFLALQNRQKELGGRDVSIPDHYRLDLADRLIDIYGDRYAESTNRLRSLAVRNSLELPFLMDGEQQGKNVERRDFGAVTRSLLNRIDVLYAVATKVHEGTLKTDAPWHDRRAGAGGLLQWAREHPVMLAVALLAPIVGIAAGLLKFWEMFGGG